MATLGSGNIEIADKENSDDLTRLNRDTTKLTKDLVNTSISSNVDGSIDARVFTADGREQIKSEIKYVINKLDDFNRFVKDKISDELTSEQKEQIGKVGLKNSILQALKKEGVSDEKINLLLNDENVRRLISDYENINNVNTSKPNNTNTHKLNNEIILKGIEVVAQKDFKDYLVDGAEAINSMVEIVGEGKAATAILITQFATQGIVKTSVSMLMEEGKDTLFGGVKDKISNYISKDLFEVNDKGWQDKQKQAIYSLSDVSADFSIDLALSGPFALMKGAKNLGKANKKFDESLNTDNTNNLLENINYTDKVKDQMKKGDYHSFPEIVDTFGKEAKVSKILGGDGIERTKLEIEGAYRGKSGIFEYIIEQDGKTVNHRLFVPYKNQ